MNLEEILKNIPLGGRAQHDAFKALHKLKYAEFKRSFLHKGVSSDHVEDVIQETFVKIFKSASNYNGAGGHGDGSAHGWLKSIKISCMNDYFEKLNRLKNESASYEEDEHLGQLEAIRSQEEKESKAVQDVNECVSAGLEDFADEHPDRYQVLMSQLDGEDISSIGRRIGRSLAATKEYLSQCRKKLAPYIEHCTELLPA
jgi:RNA polymerase sigma-70 factor (ECF subfamily)